MREKLHDLRVDLVEVGRIRNRSVNPELLGGGVQRRPLGLVERRRGGQEGKRPLDRRPQEGRAPQVTGRSGVEH